MSKKDPAEKAIRNIRRKTRRLYSSEEKIRIVLEGLRCEERLDSHLKCNSKVFEESLGGRSIAEAFSGC